MRAQDEPLVNQSMILPDDVKHVKERLIKTNERLKKGIIGALVLSILLLALAVFFLISSVANSEKESLNIQNQELSNENKELEESNYLTEKEVQGLKDNMVAVQANISKLNNDINVTTQLITDLKQNIQQNCDVFHQKVRLNESNINAFMMAVPSPGQHSKESLPVIVDLNLSNNRLGKFCENFLPDLLTLDISSNPISNISSNKLNNLASFKINQMPTLEYFDGNSFPILTHLDLSKNHITSFMNNYFPSVQDIYLDQNYLTEISNYSNLFSLTTISIKGNPIKTFKDNTFPVLASIPGIEVANLQTVSCNYFGGIENFVINCGSGQILTFQLNKMPRLNNITFQNCIYDYSKMNSNDFPFLTFLQIKGSTLLNFQYFQEFKELKEISLSSTNIVSFSMHNYQHLTSLSLSENAELASFEGNNLSNVENLLISSSQKLKDICNNEMPNLRNVLFRKIRIKSLACLSNYKYLDKIDISNHSIAQITNFNLPRLRKLVLSDGIVQSFQNNSLPSLEHLQIQLNSPWIDMSSFRANLAILSISGPLTAFSNVPLPLLTTLTLKPSNNIDFSANKFPRLTYLYLAHISMSQLDKNEFGPLQILHVTACLSQCTLIGSYDNSLMFLTIISSDFKSFTNRSMSGLINLVIINSSLQFFLINRLPNIKQIDLSNNMLDSFDCYGIDSVQLLNLNTNLITDAIANTLLSCSLPSLNFLDLRNNPQIKDKATVKSRLSQKFKTMTILI